MSENTGSVGKRTIASGAVIGFANIYGSKRSLLVSSWKLCIEVWIANLIAWGSQIYRADDAPGKHNFGRSLRILAKLIHSLPFADFKRGNLINIGFAAAAVLLWVYQKFHYKRQNARNAKRIANMTEEERAEELLAAEAKGNRSPFFVFTT
jgi:hypothetical protein